MQHATRSRRSLCVIATAISALALVRPCLGISRSLRVAPEAVDVIGGDAWPFGRRVRFLDEGAGLLRSGEAAASKDASETGGEGFPAHIDEIEEEHDDEEEDSPAAWETGEQDPLHDAERKRGSSHPLSKILHPFTLRNGTFDHWGYDIFSHPMQRRMPPPGHMFENTSPSDWALLGATVVILVAFDALVLSRLTDGDGLSDETRSELRRIFDTCDKERRSCAARQDLIAAVSGSEDAMAMFDFRTKRTAAAEPVEEKFAGLSGGRMQEVSWQEFEDFYARVSGSKGVGTIRSHLMAFAVWIVLAMVYNGIIFWQKGTDVGLEWFSGYILEWLLSMDNVFLFHLIFQAYGTPRALLQKALFVGITGAIVARMGFFVVMSSLLHRFRGIRFFFGLLLIYSGVQAARDDEEDGKAVTDNVVIRCFRAVFGSRVQSRYDLQGRAFVWANGRWEMTLIVPVMLSLVVTDVLFALDSVSAKVAQFPNYYIAYSSSVLALLGLRSVFFIVVNLVDLFDLMKYGLCFILVFIGIELMVAPWVKLPGSAVLVVIITVFVVCIAGSATRHGFGQSGGAAPLCHAPRCKSSDEGTKGEEAPPPLGE